MPRTIPLTSEGKIADAKKMLTRKCREVMNDNKVDQGEIANVLGISAQAVSRQFQRDAIRLDTVLTLIYLTGSSDIAQAMMKVSQ